VTEQNPVRFIRPVSARDRVYNIINTILRNIENDKMKIFDNIKEKKLVFLLRKKFFTALTLH